MNRRKFLGRIGLIGVGAAVAPSVLVSSNTDYVLALTPDFPTMAELMAQQQYINRLMLIMYRLKYSQSSKNQPLDTLLEGFENIESSEPWMITRGGEG